MYNHKNEKVINLFYNQLCTDHCQLQEVKTKKKKLSNLIKFYEKHEIPIDNLSL